MNATHSSTSAGRTDNLPALRRRAAFFDLDKTIIATSSAYAFGREFMHNGLISHSDAFQMSVSKATYMMAGHSSDQMDNTRDQMTNLIAGWDVAEVTRIGNEAMHTVVTPAIYAEARELIEQHRNQGFDVIIISASASHLVRPIAAELGITRIIATELEVVDGKFTGNILQYMKGDAKAQAMEDLAEERGYDMENSYAYSDSATDIPMLSLVGHPVAVNPDRPLKKWAQENGWEIRSFKHPEPLFSAPTAKEVGIGAGVLAGVAAVVGGALWLAKRYAK